MGLGRGRPACPAPPGARSAVLAPTQGRRARAATCAARPASARRVRDTVRSSRPASSARTQGRWERGDKRATEPQPGGSERSGPPRPRRDSAGTLLRPLPGSHSSPWACSQAWCQEPRLPPPAARWGGGRCAAGQPGQPDQCKDAIPSQRHPLAPGNSAAK